MLCPRFQITLSELNKDIVTMCFPDLIKRKEMKPKVLEEGVSKCLRMALLPDHTEWDVNIGPCSPPAARPQGKFGEMLTSGLDWL